MSILKQSESGTPAPTLCCEHGMSSVTFYKWRAKFGGMDAAWHASKSSKLKMPSLKRCMPKSDLRLKSFRKLTRILGFYNPNNLIIWTKILRQMCWNQQNIRMVKKYVEHPIVSIIGRGSSGKADDDYFCTSSG